METLEKKLDFIKPTIFIHKRTDKASRTYYMLTESIEHNGKPRFIRRNARISASQAEAMLTDARNEGRLLQEFASKYSDPYGPKCASFKAK